MLFYTYTSQRENEEGVRIDLLFSSLPREGAVGRQRSMFSSPPLPPPLTKWLPSRRKGLFASLCVPHTLTRSPPHTTYALSVIMYWFEFQGRAVWRTVVSPHNSIVRLHTEPHGPSATPSRLNCRKKYSNMHAQRQKLRAPYT